jgi:hypothetical protein
VSRLPNYGSERPPCLPHRLLAYIHVCIFAYTCIYTSILHICPDTDTQIDSSHNSVYNRIDTYNRIYLYTRKSERDTDRQYN